jgi:hypothetical protein
MKGFSKRRCPKVRNQNRRIKMKSKKAVSPGRGDLTGLVALGSAPRGGGGGAKGGKPSKKVLLRRSSSKAALLDKPTAAAASSMQEE